MTKLGFEIELEHTETGQFVTDYHHEMIFVLNGGVEVEFDGGRKKLGCADFLFLEANTVYNVKACEAGTLARIRISAEIVDAVIGTRFYTIKCCSTDYEEEEILAVKNILNELLRGFQQDGKNLSFRQISLFYQLLDELNMHFRETKDEISEKKFFSRDERLAQIVRYVKENYAAQISLKELAQTFHITESHLSRIIKRGLGIGFCQYVNTVRLEKATEELRRSEKSVTRIANDCGFPNVAKFNKTFKESTGKTPTEYRREMADGKNKVVGTEKADKKADARSLEQYLKQIVSTNISEDYCKQIKVDAFLAAPYTKHWERVINIGTAPELLNVKMQRHVLFLKEYLGFSYVRFWGIFQREMMLIPEEGVYAALNFDCLDEILLFLLNNGLKPFILLAPKPQTMMSRPFGKEFRRSENLNLLNYSVEEWKLLIEKLMKHFIAFFDEQEVETWIFEMWNPAPWDGAWYHWYSEEYYIETMRVVKKYAPNAMIGGCEYMQATHMPKLKGYTVMWKQSGVSPDFLSWTGFPYNEPSENTSKPQTESDYLRKLVIGIRKNMTDCGMGDKKLFITLWNNTISNRNVLNDSLWKGAYVIKNAIDTIGYADVLAYWVASDNYTIYHDTKTILFGGSGLVSKDGIAKPSMWAFSFLSKLRKQLVQKGENYIVTRSSHGNYTIVCHNMRPLNYGIYLQNEDELTAADIGSCFADSRALRLSFQICNLLGSVYNMRCQYVDKENGSIWDNWQRMGGFREIPKEDIRYLDRITVPRIQVGRARPRDGELTIDIDLEANAFCMIELMLVEM